MTEDDKGDVRKAGDPLGPDCEHDIDEDCMFCEECGRCTESLGEYDEVCWDCRAKKAKEASQTGCRITVLVDVNVPDPEEAYRRVYAMMTNAAMDDELLGWESTNEWFDAEGLPLTEEAVTAIRMKIVKENE